MLLDLVLCAMMETVHDTCDEDLPCKDAREGECLAKVMSPVTAKTQQFTIRIKASKKSSLQLQH